MPSPLEGLLVFFAALAFDQLAGEPPTQLHPVVWMGRLVELWKRFAPQKGRSAQLLYGLVAVLVSAGGLLWLSWYGLGWLRNFNLPLAIALEIFLFKGCFSLRMLGQEGLKIGGLLKQNELAAARYEMRSLVSRDTSELEAEEICGAAIESVTENSTDSFIAPLCFYLLLGVPGALAYRCVNTFDSMIGYRGKYEYLGKAAARLDDILNYLPARLAALLLIVSAPWYRGDRKLAWQIARRDHAKTASPNAGWTMAAMAGALRVRLVKVGHYSLGDSYPDHPLKPALINRAVAALYLSAAQMIALYCVITLASLVLGW
ncbi:MAG TPA: cobalamin biosynthesis protein [Chloroflexia bacterium]|nr:cobalamin biosynthesis protein [Chloroflexia bacterium]